MDSAIEMAPTLHVLHVPCTSASELELLNFAINHSASFARFFAPSTPSIWSLVHSSSSPHLTNSSSFRTCVKNHLLTLPMDSSHHPSFPESWASIDRLLGYRIK